MASLIEKKLSKLPVGTLIEVTYGDGASHYEKKQGTITDSDYTTSLELTTAAGEELLLDYSIVRGVQLLSSLQSTPKQDEIRPQEPVTSPQPREKQPLHQQTIDSWFNFSDGELKQTLDACPWEDRKLLSRAYDSFLYGVRISDAGKMLSAASLAKQIVLQEYDRGHDWSGAAVRFCGGLMHRTKSYDYRVFLTAEAFADAAYAAWREKDYTLAGAYAILELLQNSPEHPREMAVILAWSVVQTGDISGLALLRDRMPAGREDCFNTLVEDALSARGASFPAERNPDAAFAMLRSLYTQGPMAEEVEGWLSAVVERDARHPNSSPSSKRCISRSVMVFLSPLKLYVSVM